VTGTLRDPKEAIQHHSNMIMMVGLAQFAMMGQSTRGSGNRSLGETISDFFFMGLQASADLIGRRISDTTVKRLVDANFDGIKPGRYPKLVPQQIMALKFDAVVDALNKLGLAGIMTPTPELEAWLRTLMGAPEADKATIIRERAKRTVSLPGAPGAGAAQTADGGAAGAPGATEAAGAADKGGGGGKGKEGAEKGKAEVAASEAGAETAPLRSRLAPGGAPRAPRVAKGVEKFLAADEIVSALDKGRDDVAAALRKARPAIQAEIIHKVINKPVGQMHRASVAPDEKLVGQVQDILQGVHDFGRKQVGEERARQRAGAKAPDAAKVRLAAADRSKEPIGLYADGVVSQFTNTLTARATNAAIDAKRKGGLTDGQVIQGVGQDLDEQSDKWIDNVAGKGANEAFAEGRSAGFADYADEIASFLYSALLDLNTCGPCADADGAEGATEDDIPDTPNPDCDGGDLCRCVTVAVFQDEEASQK
jgi:hypothetical protein